MNRTLSSRLPRRAAPTQLTASSAIALVASIGFSRTRFQQVSSQTATPTGDASAYTVIRRYQLILDASMDDLVERVTTRFVPIISQLCGFQE